ncbi:hypothetical protein DAPPUDRAFT_249171 [Daphnia pulex]|uniref:Uncharacterized protein n=1 Tax=Daphnia pulex TaxID=6669 RepID=E9GW12_DAPPU|nr:hypothetical protein DAPPUDRAFT_249171 [Daphnia pulex]|eukprot:EFX76270.1 hypothetical protein DAPPUDRAFT_249171 [Daphnia pulex]
MIFPTFLLALLTVRARDHCREEYELYVSCVAAILVRVCMVKYSLLKYQQIWSQRTHPHKRRQPACPFLSKVTPSWRSLLNYNVVLLSDIVVSLMAGSTTSLPMSFEHEYQSAMPTPYYTTTAYASAGYYTIKSPGNYTTTYDPTSYCTDALPIPISDVNLQKDRPVCFEGHGNHYHYSAPSYNRGTVYYTNIDPDCYAAPNRYIEAPKYYTIEDYYDVMLLLGVVSLMAGSMTISTHYIDACKYHISKATRVIYTNIYASSSYCTEVSLYPKSHQQNEYYTGDLKYYTTKATKYCTTSYAVLGCYTDVSKYCSDYRQYTEAAAY